MGKEEEEGPLPRAEQLLPDSKKYPPHRVDRRWKEKKKRTEKFRFAFWRTHHVGQLRSTSSVMISSICGWEKKKIGKYMMAAASRWKGQIQNEWMNISLHLFFFLISTTFSLSLFFSNGQTLIFCFRGGECESIWIWGQRRHTTQNERPKTKRSSSSRLRESCVGRL